MYSIRDGTNEERRIKLEVMPIGSTREETIREAFRDLPIEFQILLIVFALVLIVFALLPPLLLTGMISI